MTVEPRDVVLEHGGARVPAWVAEPDRTTRGPAVVIAAEAYGLNEFTREVVARLAGEGFAVVAPDYYRGDGLAHPDDYSDFTEVIDKIGGLDFGAATKDVLAGIDHARSLPTVDPDEIVVWGYCTGGTLAMLAAAVDRRLAGAVWFFPSQPTFAELDDRHPVHAQDAIWSVACPVLLLHGDQDGLVAAAAPELDRRMTRWGIEHEVRVYAGAGHAFSSPAPNLHHAEADAASWADALAFARRVTS